MWYVIYYKDYSTNLSTEIAGRRLFSEVEFANFQQTLLDFETALQKELILYFPFYFNDAGDSINYTTAQALNETFLISEISEEEANKLFPNIDIIGNFPYEQLKETVKEAFEKLNCSTQEIVIDKISLMQLVKRYLALEVVLASGEETFVGPKIPEKYLSGFNVLKWQWNSEALDLDTLAADVITELHKRNTVLG